MVPVPANRWASTKKTYAMTMLVFNLENATPNPSAQYAACNLRATDAVIELRAKAKFNRYSFFVNACNPPGPTFTGKSYH